MIQKIQISALALLLSGVGAFAFELQPKKPETAFPADANADILGLSTGMTPDAIIQSLSERYPQIKFAIQRYGFPETELSFVDNIRTSAGGIASNGARESFQLKASTPASMNIVHAFRRDTSFPLDEPPKLQPIIDGLIAKYGVPSAVNGSGHWVWAYKDGQRVGLPEEQVKGLIFNPEAVGALTTTTGKPINDKMFHSCANLGGNWDQLYPLDRFACDAFIKVNLMPKNGFEDRAISLSVTLVDLKARMSSAEIDNAAIKAANDFAKSKVGAVKAPEL